jgi:glycine cleavage system H lipoate-binding protein
MEGFSYVDMFASKGIEYILVIVFLLIFMMYWKLLSKSQKSAELNMTVQPDGSISDWFHLAKNVYYHQGHSWVKPESNGLVSVGIDDFAQKLIGIPDRVNLPKVGSKIIQGEKGLNFQFNSKCIDMLSPVDGDIVEINENVLKNPELIGQDPYHKGWLFKVKALRMKPNLKNLLSGKLAVAWMENTVKTLRLRMSGEMGLVMQDGGLPIAGFAKELSPDNWEEVAADFFLTR